MEDKTKDIPETFEEVAEEKAEETLEGQINYMWDEYELTYVIALGRKDIPVVMLTMGFLGILFIVAGCSAFAESCTERSEEGRYALLELLSGP